MIKSAVDFQKTYENKCVEDKHIIVCIWQNRAVREGVITPENLGPNPKNPIIASFFRNICYSDQLGPGVRNLFKYTKLYSEFFCQ